MKLKASDFRREDSLVNAGIKGFNYQTELPRIFREKIPEFRKWIFGFCDEGNLAHWLMIGWIPLTNEHFDNDEYNKVAGMGLQITQTDGRLRIMDNYIMVIEKDRFELIQDIRNEEAAKMERSGLEGEKYIPPGYKSGDMGGTATLERSKVIARGEKNAPDVDVPKKRGRPPNKKKG